MSRPGRRLFVPEVLQTSMMDCGPVTLKAAFDGFNRPVNLERLRDLCQTDVDGTSLSLMYETASRLGLNVDQAMVPKDHLLLPEAKSLPAIVFMANPEGLLHYAMIWRTFGPLVQILDPARGRLWVPASRLARMVSVHTLDLTEAKWRRWAGGANFCLPLAARMRALGVDSAEADALIAEAKRDATPRSLGALDAATRMTRSLVDGRAIPRGAAAARLLRKSYETDRGAEAAADRTTPAPYWGYAPSEKPGHVAATGAVCLIVRGVAREVEGARGGRGEAAKGRGPPGDAVLPGDVMRELRASTVRPHRALASMLWSESPAPALLLGVVAASVVAMSALDALLMRGLSDIVGRINVVSHRLVAVLAIATFMSLALAFQTIETYLVQRFGRALETRLRIAFLEKLPRLKDAYFRSRPMSDMASRAHLLQSARDLPHFFVELVSNVFQLFATAGILIWLAPGLAGLTLGLLVACLLFPLATYWLLDEPLARVRVHGGTLFRFYLDALCGTVPIRVHGAERAIRRRHEAILTEWVRSSQSVEARTVGVRALERLFGALVAAALVVGFVRSGGGLQALLLVAYFAQRLPAHADALGASTRVYPIIKHDMLRAFEVLSASESDVPALAGAAEAGAGAGGVDVTFRRVTASAGGHAVLSEIDLDVPRGAHVAVVGHSGAGKTSLVGVLLGWLSASHGEVLVDGRPLDGAGLARLRRETAWVDPSVQLWNDTLFNNLFYGHDDEALPGLQSTLADADLLDVIERLPGGLQSPLGESGARVSCGQGQRVRLGRALLKGSARLVILDEPFRGLQRDRRRELLRRARENWPSATLFFVSHDVGDTLELDRVLVVEEGRLIEDGTPQALLERGGRYRDLVQADRRARAEVWGRPEWRRMTLRDGALAEAPPAGAAP